MGIINFEEYTHELTDVEKTIYIPVIVEALSKKIGKNKAVTNKQMCAGLKKKLEYNITGPRMRKIIQYIRMEGLIERLVATSKGYYIENDMGELSKYIESVMQRGESIIAMAKQLDFQRKKFIKEQS